MDDIDLNAAARIDEAIAATGASTVDFEVTHRKPKGVSESLASLTGQYPVQFVFTVEPDGMDVDSPERADAPAGPSDDTRDEAAVIADVLTAIWGANPQAPVSELDAEHLLGKLESKFDDDTVADAVDAANWDWEDVIDTDD